MGQKITEIITPTQEIYDGSKMKKQIDMFNKFFRANEQKVGFRMFIVEKTMVFDYHNWKRSKFQVIYAIPENNSADTVITDYSQMSRPGKKHLHLKVQEIQQINHVIQPYCVNMSRATPGRESLEEATKTKIKSAISESEQNLCCICYDDQEKMVLPCTHGFCKKCTKEFIIEKDESKCPICRFQMMGSSSAVEKQIYTIIDFEDKYEELRHRLFMTIQKSNSKQVIDELGKMSEQFLKNAKQRQGPKNNQMVRIQEQQIE